MIILGLDPGTRTTGYAVIRVNEKKYEALAIGRLELHAYKQHALRLQKIWSKCEGLIREFEPRVMAIEAPFYGKNPQAALKLGRAQGVAMAAALHHGLAVFEYAPREIKHAVTGNGAASKEQTARMALAHLGQCTPDPLATGLDAFDALSVALAHAFKITRSLPPAAPAPRLKKTTWSDFVRQNPQRLKS
jgi:crossover junction endodeoxyribonuclease RuvC